MKGLIRGAAGLAVVLAMSACSKDETIDLMGAPTGVQATPVSAFTTKGDSVAILLRLVNDRNQSVPTEFTVGNAGPSITIHYDDKYRPDYTSGELVPPAVKPQQRYFALGTLNGTSTFTATSGGFTNTITVVVLPKTLEAAISKLTGNNFGDTLTITAPQGTKFTPASVPTFATGTITVASRSADSSSMLVVLGLGVGGAITVTNVYLPYAPTLALRTLTSSTTATSTPQLANLGPALSPTTGLVAGSPVTITAPAGLVFSQTSAVSFASGPNAIQSRSADSTTITVLVGPGTAGIATVTKVGIVKAPGVGVFTLPTTNAVTAIPALTVAPTTVSTAAPAFGATMTATLGGGLRFTSTSTISIGGRAAFLLSRSADSSTATFVPYGGSNGNITYTNIVLSFLNGVGLAVPGDKTVTVGAPTADPNAGSIATASTIALPAVGSTLIFSDGGAYTAGGPCALAALSGNGCRYYKIVLAAPLKVTGNLKWDPATTTDLGVYLVNAAGTASLGTMADAAGNQAGGTESIAAAGFTLPAGTSFITIVYYNSGPQPPFFHLTLTGLP